MTPPIIVLAGAGGDLGQRIARALVARGATVRTLVRPGASQQDTNRIAALGVTIVPADPGDVGAVAAACEGADCVVSALNGLRDVIVDRQGVLLDAAVEAGVPRFVSSDFSLDFTRTEPGGNRNLDLRREFMARADATAARSPIRITSVLNGGFMDMLGAEMPLIQNRVRRVLHWGDADQPLDFTTKDDTAAYTAAAALDPAAPRILRVAGDALSPRDLARVMSEAVGARYRPFRVGGIGMLGAMIGLAKLIAPRPGALFPPWQGLQYMRDMFGGRGKLRPLDNDRYPDIRPTRFSEFLGRRAAGTTS